MIPTNAVIPIVGTTYINWMLDSFRGVDAHLTTAHLTSRPTPPRISSLTIHPRYSSHTTPPLITPIHISHHSLHSHTTRPIPLLISAHNTYHKTIYFVYDPPYRHLFHIIFYAAIYFALRISYLFTQYYSLYPII